MSTLRLALQHAEQDTLTVSDQNSPSVLSEDLFLRMLRLERRRSERSGRAFILVLASGDVLHAANHPEVSAKICTSLATCIRETDLLGWYAEGSVLGLILMDVADTSSATIETVVQKVSASLARSLSVDAYCRLTTTVRVYPDDSKDELLYPDLEPRKKDTRTDSGLKRAIDVVGSFLAILLFLPLLLTIALLVKCTSKGPILFCQQRMGRYGKAFCFYKFRTMRIDNDPEIHRQFVTRLIAGQVDGLQGGALFKLQNDPRVTPIGRFLRRTSLDELPQFFNVLHNDMSLVGPRPPLPYEYENYRSWHRRRVLELKPGITGLWQIEGRSRTTFDEMVRMDIRYSRMRTVWMDFKIIFRTPAAMFSGRGAC